MRVVFVTPYYPPEVGAPQTRIHELAVRLAGMGHTVSILTTFPNYPSGIVPPEWRGKFFSKTSEQGLTVYRVWSYATPNRGFLRRIISHLSFALFASLATLFLPAYDTLVIESPPLFDGFIGVIAAALRRKPYLFMVSDLWPESAVQMGVLKNRFLISASKAIELLFYRRAAGVLALTAGIRTGIVGDGIDPVKVVLFRNSVDCKFFRPEVSGSRLRAELGVADSDYLVLYAGTLGMAQNLAVVLEAAALLQSSGQCGVRFLMAGDGAESDDLKTRARSLGVENVSFLDPLPKKRMPELINAADCVLVPLRDLEIFRGALPTKMFEAMACGKPVVLGIRGEAEELVRAAGAGLCVAPDTPSAIRDAVLALRHDLPAAAQMGHQGRNYIVKHFSREARARELSAALEEFARAADRRSRLVCPPSPTEIPGD